jgi:predicted Zn-dependent protease with MMP-like domain
MRMSHRHFEQMVERSLALIPEEFRPFLQGVPVVVEEEPSEALLDDLGVPEDETLLGLFVGPALDEEAPGSGQMPARIIIYRLPHLEEAEDLPSLEREVARTVIHEVAHRFGIGEERLEELGWD